MRWLSWGYCFRLVAGLLLGCPLAEAAAVPLVERVEFAERAPERQRAEWIEVCVHLQARRVSGEGEVAPWRVRFSGLWAAQRGEAKQWAAVQETTFAPPSVETRLAVSFFVPPGVVEMWQMEAEPTAWRVQVWTGDQEIAVAPTMYATALRDREAAQAFLLRVADARVQESRWLLPARATPFYQPEDLRWPLWPAFLEVGR
ncbi:MAG: hypothetical protein Q7P63_04065 [Verrucomicrobiota bacterium JB022]|nr:hypothetical protein [Verrucomicrobiota bacterium JB022]